MAEPNSSIARDLKSAYERFEKWRTTRTGRSRIPAELWELAVCLAQRHGSYRVSKALRLGYRDLKRRVASSGPGIQKQKSSSPFVTLDLSRSNPIPECVVEFQEPDGSRMILRFAGTSTIDMVALSKAFFGRGR